MTKAGMPCKGHALPGQEVCLFHDPSRADAVARGRQRGGFSNRRKFLPVVVKDGDAVTLSVKDLDRIETPEQMQSLLSAMIPLVLTGTVDSKAVNSTVSLAHAWLRAHEQAQAERDTMQKLSANLAVLIRARGRWLGGPPDDAQQKAADVVAAEVALITDELLAEINRKKSHRQSSGK